VRRLALALLLLALPAATPPADAQSASATLDLAQAPTAGPVWAGERIAWVSGNRVFVRDPDGRTRTVDRWRWEHRPLVPAIAASSSLIAVWRGEEDCADCRGDFQTVLSELRTGPPDGPLQPRAACALGENVPLVTGDVLGLRCGGAVSVFDDATGGGERRFGPATGPYAFPGALEGRYVAYAGGDYEHPRVVVADWRTGEELYSVAASALDIDVASDGSVAWTTRRAVSGARAYWASPDDPVAHDLGVDADTVQIDRDVVVAFTLDHFAQPLSRGRLTAVARDGRALGSIPARSGWALDAARVVTSVAPCHLPTIQVWDLTAEPPPDLGRGCGLPRILSRTVRFDRRGRTSIAVACPATHPGGCGRELVVGALPYCPRSACIGPRTPFGLRPGERARIAIRADPSLVRRLRRTHGRRVHVWFEVGATHLPGAILPVRLPR
jgi:hypothetical protein